MIEFMIIAAPRSGTTWAANWLTTDNTLCLHDPLWTRHYSELDSIKSLKTVGISCTGIMYFHEFLNKHSARKVILHRDLNEINKSLCDIGLTEMEQKNIDVLSKINGIHRHWTEIFDSPKKIYEYLLELPFDEERHDQLKEIEMQPHFDGLTIGKETTRKFLEELRSI